MYLSFLALVDANDTYSSKLASGTAAHQALLAVGWTVDELSRLSDQERTLLVQCQTIKE